MKKFINHLSVHFVLICFILFALIIPYVGVSLYLPKIPHMHILFLLALLIFYLIDARNPDFQKSLRQKVSKNLQGELKKNPSKQELTTAVFKSLQFRRVTMAISALIIFLISIYFKHIHNQNM